MANQSGSIQGPIIVESATGTISHGDTIRFDVETTGVDYPVLSVKGYRDGELIYASGGYQRGVSPSEQEFKLSSMSWTNGPAHLVATLSSLSIKNMRERELDSLDFEAA
jgi:hypothetical protein